MGVYNFSIKKNAAFSRTIIWKNSAGEPVDLTGKSASLVAKVRRSDTVPVISITDADNISLGTTNGAITITFNKSFVNELNFRYAMYDLFIDDVALFSGEITVLESSY